MPISYDPKAAWPPKHWSIHYDKFAEWAAWYSGDAQGLCDYYVSRLAQFWGKPVAAGERSVHVHVPVAGDISSTSAALLFGEKPKLGVRGEGLGASPETTATQGRLEEIIAQANVFSRWLEAAEVASAMGGVFLKVDWDRELTDFPLLSIAQVDAALPEFLYGILRAVTFWRVLDAGGTTVPGVQRMHGRDARATVWRHLERHELDGNGKGLILNYLFKGTDSAIGNPVSLAARQETAKLPAVIETGIAGLLCRYIPNMRPNRLWRGSYLGQSDYSGSEGLMDSLDETMSNWLRDVRLAKGRIIAPERYFQSDGQGRVSFDVDREAYVTLNVPPSPEGLKNEIALSQFEIRAAEHQQTALQLIITIITNAGYSPQTFGIQVEGYSESGTALNIRRDKSYKTTAKKAEYWKTPLEDLLAIMLQVDRLHLGGKTLPVRPVVEMQDGATPDISQTAQTVELLHRAQAASTEVKVSLLHPDWTAEQVYAEVAKIRDEGNELKIKS